MFDTPGAPDPAAGPLVSWLRFVIRDAILGDAPGRLVHARLAVPLVAGLTGLYVAASLVFARADIAVPFAIVPLALAAFLLPAVRSIVLVALTYGTVFVAEELTVNASGLTLLEIVELV